VAVAALTCGFANAASPIVSAQAATPTRPANQKTAFAPPSGPSALAGMGSPAAAMPDDSVLTFSTPPRESAEEAAKLYQPVIEYLSRITGKTIVYKHPGNWLTYQTEMQKGAYDLVFDGPHLNSWRIANLNHNTLARLGDDHGFAVIVRKDSFANDLKHLAGQKICGMNPPNLGTLAVLAEFNNPMRQPFLLDTVGWNKVYEGVVMDKRCSAGIVPIGNLKRLDTVGAFTKVIHRTRAMPNQAFSAGPKVARDTQARIASALTSVEGQAATAALRAAYGSEKGFVAATREEYAGLDSYLKDSWGYAR
jgi:ABC-type phosphate/phosphonate transport system substrate-binding protein